MTTVMNESIQRFITERNEDSFGKTQAGRDGVLLRFTLPYYDTYALLALTKKHIQYLDEDILKEVKIHKGKLYFTVSYDSNYDSFELDSIIFGSPLSKCIKVVTAIKRLLAKYNVGSVIDSFPKDKVPHTSVTLTKLST